MEAAVIGTRSALLLGVLGIAGCVSVRLGDATTDAALKEFSTRPDVAGVYIYCDQWMGVGQITNVEIDGKPFGQNTSSTYLHVDVAFGGHKVTIEQARFRWRHQQRWNGRK
jgi:hypothetical protein